MADDAAPTVSVTGGVVSVDGLPDAEVYNIAGRRMPAGQRLPRGLYVVATPRGAMKAAVREAEGEFCSIGRAGVGVRCRPALGFHMRFYLKNTILASNVTQWKS